MSTGLTFDIGLIRNIREPDLLTLFLRRDSTQRGRVEAHHRVGGRACPSVCGVVVWGGRPNAAGVARAWDDGVSEDVAGRAVAAREHGQGAARSGRWSCCEDAVA